jgi:23S rRNA (adenine2503-C2)-methyltransferase
MTAPSPKENLLNYTPADASVRLREFFERIGQPAYRTAQVVRRLWMNPAPDFNAMTELPRALREQLEATFDLPRLLMAARQRSIDGTEKFLFTLDDGQSVETVAIPDNDRLTLCISSQAGCALRCAFCATGAMGFQRNLTPFEIAGQVREMRLLDPPVHVTNIVFMGMGEPLMNWKAVDPTLTILNDPSGLAIGARHITVSTVGVLPGIVALSERPEQFRLALSIHAPSDALRQELMPINTKYPLADVIQAAKVFDRRVTFEYVMLGGVNDGEEHALNLAALAHECRAFVNLIPLHPGGARGFTASPRDRIAAFARELRAQNVEVAVRKSRGMDIAAACGQLRVERLGRRAPRAADQHGEVHVKR